MGIGTVKTSFGRIKGREITEGKYAGISYFGGIPYAKPPVGELRWKPPADLEPWDGVRDCVGFGDRPLQVVQGGENFEPWGSDFFFAPDPPMSEDCLYMSLATGAASTEEKRPVFIWFHGGGLSNGHYYEPEFDLSELARKGVIAISVGQRLNALGYLCLPQLTAERGTSGNYGLMDEIKAFEWIRANITAFGGDPDNITVAGQSGGTAKSGALSTVPTLKGKIKRVINQSSLYWLNFRKYPEVAEAELEGLKFLEKIGVDPNATLEELRAIPGERFSERFGAPSSMVWDGTLIKYQDQVQNQAEFAADCDYLVGINYGECSMANSMMWHGNKITAEWVRTRAKEMLGDLYDKYDFLKNVKLTDKNADHISRRLAVQGLTDNAFFGGVAIDCLFGGCRTEKAPGNKVYSYIFSRVPPCRPEERGTVRDSDKLLAWHSGELWYTFGSLRDGTPPARPWEETDYRLADQVSGYWANFVKTGNPNGEGLPYWPASTGDYTYMELGDDLKANDGAHDDISKAIWEYAKKRTELPK